MTSPSNPTATRVAGIAVSDAHRYRTAIEAAQHAGIPDRLIAAAFHLGQNAHDDNSPETDQDAPDDFNTTAYDNILAVAYSAAEGWTTDAMMRVLTAHEHAGHRNVPVGLVLRDLTRALAPVERLTPHWHEVTTWLNEHDWINEYVQYIRAGHLNHADNMVRARIPFRYGARTLNTPINNERWLNLVEIALLREDGTDPAEALDILLPYLYDTRVNKASLVTLYTLVRKRGVDHALLTGLAGLTRDEALAYTGDPDTLRAMAALRDP